MSIYDDIKDLKQRSEDVNKNPMDSVTFQSHKNTSTPYVRIDGYRLVLDTDKLPTSDPSVPGMLWSDNGNIVISGYTVPSPYISGMIMPYAGTTSPTSQGWLLLGAGFTIGDASSGATYASASYETLFNMLKSYWGNAGTETFSNHDTVLLPDPTSASFVGAGTSTGYTENETTSFGTSYDDQFQGHTFGDGLGNRLKYNGTNLSFSAGSIIMARWASGTQSQIISDGVNGTPRVGNTTRGKTVGVNYIIKF